MVPSVGSRGRVCLVVKDSIYGAIESKLVQHIQELETEGYTVIAYRFISGTPEGLRSYLCGLYNESDSLAGAEFIGNIPYIIYELMQDWGSGSEYEDFPCDVFYMDIDGVWEDIREEGSVHAGNGKYDTRSGNLDLEIWVSRIKTDNLTSLGAETTILNNYFDKTHNYRLGIVHPLHSALVYDDDDWSSMGSSDQSYLQSVYGASAITLVNTPEDTTASDYKINRMPVNQEFIFTRSHGWPGGHGYYRSNKSTFEYVFASDYCSIDPPALFYSFFVCSGCDYTADNYLGGIAAFNENAGLVAWGSTKTGGMWQDSKFYSSLGEGKCFGSAFVDWFNDVQTTYPSYTPRWWYGMVLIGDVTLCPTYRTVAASVSGGHGTVSPASQDTPYGGTATITITPDSHYHIASITDNSSPATIANPYIITNVTEAHTVVVTFTIDIDTLTITTASPLPAGTVSAAYSQNVSATGGVTSYTWSISAGSLPTGSPAFAINASTGAITGTPTTTTGSPFTFTVSVHDSQGPTPATATKEFSIVINPAESISVVVSPNTLWSIGSISLSSVNESEGYTATNDGNVTEDFKIKATNGANGWTVGGSPGTDIFTAEVDKGDNGTYDITLITSDQDLVNSVGVGDSQVFGLRYHAPSLDTQGGGKAHDFTITITASKTP